MSQGNLWHFVYDGRFWFGREEKKVPLSIIIIGVLALLLAAYYIYVHVSTTPEEEAYAAAVQRVVELFDERSNKAQQEKEEEEEKTESYVEKIAKEEELEARPYFDTYHKEYVSKEKDAYLVELPVQEILNSKVIQEYTYEIRVKEKDGKYTVVSMEKRN